MEDILAFITKNVPKRLGPINNHKGMQIGRFPDGYVYLVYFPEYEYLGYKFGGNYKIGRTMYPQKRFAVLRGSREIEIIHLIKSERSDLLEAELHEKYKAKIVDRERFALSTEDIDYIKNL